ncbi:MAG: hypothetical protein N2Z79_04820 [Candidatus Omnitrophica bacterium]|nr:hypothetical protein [Candidatus Omnitrophota bacterium]
MIKVAIPQLGEDIEKATITYWFFKEGQRVKEGEDLVELTTDKAVFNLPSPTTGILSQILFLEGQTANVGEVIALIEEENQ